MSRWRSKEGFAVMLISGILIAYVIVVLSGFFWDGADL
jgi:hypothetical protein